MATVYVSTPVTVFFAVLQEHAAAQAVPSSSAVPRYVRRASAAVSLATPVSGAAPVRALPAEVAVSLAPAASGAVVVAAATCAARSLADAVSYVTGRARMRAVARSTATPQSRAVLVLGYTLGDAQQPLPSRGLALTMTDTQVRTGNTTRTAHPAAFYDNYPFNSFAVLGSVAYAAGPAGVYVLTGGDEAFTTRVHLGRRDFGTRTRKALREVGVARTAGAAVVVIAADGGVGYRYPVNPQRGAGRMERAVPGRGLIGTTLEVEVRGDTALAVEAVEALLNVGERR